MNNTNNQAAYYINDRVVEVLKKIETELNVSILSTYKFTVTSNVLCMKVMLNSIKESEKDNE